MPLILALVAVAGALLGSWWLDARPVPVVDGPPTALQCVSYAPSGGAYQPLQRVTREQIERDLQLLATRTSCVRTYTVSDGFDLVPAVAGELGMQVLLGAWISRDPRHNEREVALAIEVAQRHRDVIRAIVVGNEVLLRHELPPAELATLIRRVATATQLPVTYADVWGFWLKHRVLSESVSFITVHIIPYWDDDPVGIDAVIPYVDGLHAEMQRRFPGKAVLIGETGWPSAGRPRGAIETGRVNQARYVREFAALAEQRGFRYNLIEAFDQPWKRVPEGTVGGHWGLFDVAGTAKFPWTGPVAEAPHGTSVVALALAAALLGAGVGWLRGGRVRARAAVTFAAASAVLVAVGARQLDDVLAGSASTLEWIGTLAVVAAGWLAFGLAVRAMPGAPGTLDPVPPPLTLALLVCCAYVCLGLVFAGRHRDFPVWLFLPGALGLAFSAAGHARQRAERLRRDRRVDEVLLAGWLATAGCLVPLQERFGNTPSIAWGAVSLVLGSAILLPLALQSRQDQGAAQHAHAGPGESVEHHADGSDRGGKDGRDG